MSLKINISQNIRSLSYYKLRNWYANLTKPKAGKPPYKHVVQIGDPILRSIAEPVPENSIKSEHIQSLINQMKHVFNKYNCCGLAAPQIGASLRIIVIGFTKNHLKQYDKEEIRLKNIEVLPVTVLINPELRITDYNKVLYPESCNSVKGYWANVPRYFALELKGFDENGSAKTLIAKGWNARIAQHEMDHLNGKLYTDIMDRKTLTCGCWDVINERNGKVTLPFGY